MGRPKAQDIYGLLTVVGLAVSESKPSPATTQAIQARTAKFKLR
jgi:hypothetical protein